MIRSLSLATALSFFFLSACRSAPAVDAQSIQTVLDSILAQHAQHAIREDLDAIVADYTEDAVVRSNHTDPIRGREALRSFFTQVFAAVDTRSLVYDTERLSVYGDTAWQIATYEMVAQPPGQPESRERGSVVALWVRDEAGRWRIQEDVVNSSVPFVQP